MATLKSLIAWFTFPVLFVGTLLAFDTALRLGFDPALTSLAVTIANLALIATLELVLPERPDWTWTNDRQTFNDLLHGLSNIFGDALGRSALLILFATAGGALGAQGNLGLWPADLPLWAQVLVAVVVVDFADYCKHRAYHSWSIAWPIHALHHNADRMTVFKGARLHFLEATIRALVVYGPLVALGAPTLVLLWLAALMNFLGNLNHSNLAQNLPRFVHAMIVTQKTHWLHHSKDYARGVCNLAPLTPLFDHLFGTFRHPLDEPLEGVGIDPDPIPKNLCAQLAAPLLWPVLVWREKRARRSALPAAE